MLLVGLLEAPAAWAEHKRSYAQCLVSFLCPPCTERNEAWPVPYWQYREPADVDMDKDELVAMSNLVGGHGVVIRHGFIVHSWGHPDYSHDIASAMKPVLSILLLIALQEGLIDSVDEPLVRYEPRLADVHGGERITWRHLANQTSGYGLGEAPGEAYAYNDYAVALYYDLLIKRVFQQDADEVLRTRLAEPLGFEDDYTFQAFGPHDRPGRLALSPRDFARIGLMYLRQGWWNGQQILEPELIEKSLNSVVPADMPLTSGETAPMLPGQRSIGGTRNLKDIGPGFYTFNWWVNGEDDEGRQLYVGAPEDTYLASGHLGKRKLWVIPSLDLVVVWNDTRVDDLTESPGNTDTLSNRAVHLLVESVTERRAGLAAAANRLICPRSRFWQSLRFAASAGFSSAVPYLTFLAAALADRIAGDGGQARRAAGPDKPQAGENQGSENPRIR
ncbi:MAG TPA: serine hydrolase [Arenicellales bacterium]|nr:serine hydrolase [Arenicellales bacterium]